MKKITPIVIGLALATIIIAGFFSSYWMLPLILTATIAVCIILEKQKKNYSPPTFWIGIFLGILLCFWGVGTIGQLCGLNFLGQGFWATWGYGFLTITAITALATIVMLPEVALGNILFWIFIFCTLPLFIYDYGVKVKKSWKRKLAFCGIILCLGVQSWLLGMAAHWCGIPLFFDSYHLSSALLGAIILAIPYGLGFGITQLNKYQRKKTRMR